MEKRFLINHVKYNEDSGRYQRWDGLDEDGNHFYDNEKFIGYYENNMVEKIPLPENVYHAIIFADKNSEWFISEDDEYIFASSDYIDAGYLKPVEDVHFVLPMDEEPYFFFAFYEYSDLQYALDQLSEFEKEKNKA